MSRVGELRCLLPASPPNSPAPNARQGTTSCLSHRPWKKRALLPFRDDGDNDDDSAEYGERRQLLTCLYSGNRPNAHRTPWTPHRPPFGRVADPQPSSSTGPSPTWCCYRPTCSTPGPLTKRRHTACPCTACCSAHCPQEPLPRRPRPRAPRRRARDDRAAACKNAATILLRGQGL